MKKTLIITLTLFLAFIISLTPHVSRAQFSDTMSPPKSDTMSPPKSDTMSPPKSDTMSPPSRGGGDSGAPFIQNPLSHASSLEELIFNLVNTVLKLGAIAAVLALIWVGFQFVLARGSDTKIAEARYSFYWTIIGIAVLFGAKVIAEIVRATIENLGQF